MSSGRRWFSRKALFFSQNITVSTSHHPSILAPHPLLHLVGPGCGHQSKVPAQSSPSRPSFLHLARLLTPPLAGSPLSARGPASPGSSVLLQLPLLCLPCGLVFSAYTEMLGLLRALPRPSALSRVTSSPPALERKGTSFYPIASTGPGALQRWAYLFPQDSPCKVSRNSIPI